MAKKIKQFRYFKDGKSDKNSAGVESKASFVNGEIFNKYSPIVQLGIQALPGTKFYLNDINALNREPIIIGRTGIFELSLNQAKINSIAFDEKSMETINENENAYLIVDILYEEED